jgi:alpha-tubulin suppressor-like RCC1 family protein
MVRPTMIALWSVLLLAAHEGNDLGTNRSGEAAGRQAPPLPTVSVGTEHGCGLAAGGQAYCWGSNRLGQLGDDRVTSVAATVASAVPVATTQSFTTISAGANHTCAITAAGEAYCWGLNLTGELAQALVANDCDGFPCSRHPVRVETSARFDTVSAGFGHTCALSLGRAFCWGRNDRGQLGAPRADGRCDGIACNVTPMRVSTADGLASMTFTSISAGGDHTCGIAGGVAYCWGSNQYGQLGLPMSVQSSSRPIGVPSVERLVSIQAKGIRTCGRTPTGRELCWGTAGATMP